MERIIAEGKKVVRHRPLEIVEHWLIALSGFVLLFSGFGGMPMYKRYMVTEIPLMGWSGDFFIQLKIHYLAALVFVSTAVFHVLYHGLKKDRGLLPRRGDFSASWRTILSFLGIGREPPAHKYLAEQRLAYAYLAVVMGILIMTGLIKVAGNLPGVFLPPTLATSVTLIHVAATVLFLFGVVAHLGAFLFKVNRPLLPAVFSGKVDLDYVRHRHPLWHEELAGGMETAKEEPSPEEREGARKKTFPEGGRSPDPPLVL